MKRSIIRNVLMAGLVCPCAWALAQTSLGQTKTPADTADAQTTETPAADEQPLHVLEQALLRDFERFEEKLLELAEYTRRNDPDRAELLVRTRSESTSRRVQAQMRRIANALAPTDSGDVLYGDALARQEELMGDLAEILRLLQSEDERDRIDREILRLKDLLKDTNRLIGQQKDVRADTERGGESSKLLDDQQDVSEKADQLAEKMSRQDAERQAEEDRKSGGRSPKGEKSEGEKANGEKGDPAEGQSKEGETGEPKGDEQGEPKSGESKGGESKEGESKEGKPSDQQPSSEDAPGQPEAPKKDQQGQPSQGQPSPGGQQSQPSPSGQQSQQQQQQTPGREQLEQARQQMQQAIDELEDKRLDKASGEQDAALARLEELKAELEEILRQLREEEKKLFLMALEARFQRMLERQLDINNGTLKLDRVVIEERDNDRHLAQSTKLSRDEGDNITDAEKALMLLREDGSSVAFPEAVEMMRDNMRAVVTRLRRGETGETTQLLERMIVESLEEIVFALQREMEKQDEKEQQPGESQQGQPQDQSLVDALAELKMIRSLQSQINRLTRQYGLDIDGEQATAPEALDFLRTLSGRQERIQDATYDLSIGKNQ